MTDPRITADLTKKDDINKLYEEVKKISPDGINIL